MFVPGRKINPALYQAEGPWAPLGPHNRFPNRKTNFASAQLLLFSPQ